jgi:hypothetical protein
MDGLKITTMPKQRKIIGYDGPSGAYAPLTASSCL